MTRNCKAGSSPKMGAMTRSSDSLTARTTLFAVNPRWLTNCRSVGQMHVESYNHEAAALAVATAATDLTGLEVYALTVLHPPGFGRTTFETSGFGDGTIVVRTNRRTGPGSLVQLGIGQTIIVFGTVRQVMPAANEPGFFCEIAVTSAFIRQTRFEEKN